MVQELGKIEKPEVEQFKGKRKLLLVPLLFSWKDAPPEYVEKFDTYWQQVREQVLSLEQKIGDITRIYHETVAESGEEGLKILEKLNDTTYRIISNKCQRGAHFEAVEDKELVDESIDWERHLMMGFVSAKAASVISSLFVEVFKKRYDYIAKKVNETLGSNEVAMLFIQESHGVQFPPDIEVFTVSPPVLDEIRRWMRNRPAEKEEEK